MKLISRLFIRVSDAVIGSVSALDMDEGRREN